MKFVLRKGTFALEQDRETFSATMDNTVIRTMIRVLGLSSFNEDPAFLVSHTNILLSYFFIRILNIHQVSVFYFILACFCLWFQTSKSLSYILVHLIFKELY